MRTVDYGMSLVTPDGSAVNLSFTGKQPSQSLVGERVVASGHYTPSGFSVSSGGLHVARPDGAANARTTAGSNTAAPTVYSSGNHRLAVIMINFQDDQSQPFTKAAATGVAFTNSDSVAAYYKEVSWSHLTLSGAVYGWYTLPMSKGSSCSYTSWANAANTAAAADGFSINNYDNVVYAFPYATGCHWGGLAYKPGKQAWLNGQYSMSLHTMAHELGHNFGTDHAASISCTQNGVRVSLVSDISTCTYKRVRRPLLGHGCRHQAAHRYRSCLELRLASLFGNSHGNLNRRLSNHAGGAAGRYADPSDPAQLRQPGSRSSFVSHSASTTSARRPRPSTE